MPASVSSCLSRDLGHEQLQPRSTGLGWDALRNAPFPGTRRPHGLGRPSSRVPQWTPRAHSQQEDTFPQCPRDGARVWGAGTSCPIARAQRTCHSSSAWVPSSPTFIVSHLHTGTHGCEVRTHRRLCPGCLPQGAGLRDTAPRLHLFGGLTLPHTVACGRV